jgi:hypothetical protein
MISIFLFLFLLGVALIFGGSICLYVLKERRLFAFIPFTILIGVNGYNFFVNIISYIIPVQSAMWAVLILMLCISSIIYVLRDKTELNTLINPLAPNQLRILLIAAMLIAMVSGLVALRSLELDDLSMTHLSLAATISAGNFPVKNPMSPSHLMNYHYGPDLLTASLHNVARVPLWLGYDIQTIIFSGLIFLMAFLLAFEIIGRFRSSCLAAFLTLYGGGLSWLNFTHGISPLWRKFVLHEQVIAPWAFVWEMIYPKLGSSSLVYGMNNHSGAIGFPVMFGAIYCYLKIFNREEKGPRPYACMSGLLLGYLALNLETNFAITIVAMVIFFAAKAVSCFKRGMVDNIKKNSGYFLIVIAIGIFIALFQGGIFTATEGAAAGLTVAFKRQFWLIDQGARNAEMTIFGSDFLKGFGLTVSLFLAAVWFYRRNARVIFMALIAGGAFLAVLFVRYVPRPWEMLRLFGLFGAVSFFVIGLFLGDLSLKLKQNYADKYKYFRAIIIFVIFLVVLSAFLFQFTSLFTPFGETGRFDMPFFAIPPRPKEIDRQAYDWIKKNTSIKDNFYPYGEIFVREAGRFTPGFNAGQATAVFPNEILLYDNFTNSCSLDALKKLKINYLYISPDFPLKNFYTKCLPNLSGRTVFRTQVGNDFREIYKLDLN